MEPHWRPQSSSPFVPSSPKEEGSRQLFPVIDSKIIIINFVAMVDVMLLHWIETKNLRLDQNSRHSTDSKAKSYQLRRRCLRLTWDCSISALFSLMPRISAASLWKQRCTYVGERRRNWPTSRSLHTQHFSTDTEKERVCLLTESPVFADTN